MRLNIINQFSLETGTEVVRRLRTRKTEELLVFLALHQTRWVARTEVLEQIWPDDDDQPARQKLRLALHSIRSVIGSKLESNGDLVKVKDIEVDFNKADLLNLPPGWRLMPGHEVEWLDLIAASGEARQQLSTLSQLETTTDKANSLAYLISTDPGEPSLYQDLFDHYTKQGSRAAASVVASFARLNLGRNCPPELSQTTKTQIRSDFVGRLRELANLAETLLGNQEPAAIQLNGVGGMGKTRLAAELASLAPAENIPVAWVSLAGVTTEHDALTKLQAAIVEALSITRDEAKDPQEISSLLVVLDNADLAPLNFLNAYEQSGCGLRILVTSQAYSSGLGRAIALQPLSLPRGSGLDQASQSEAIMLLTFLSGKPLSESNLPSYRILAEESGGVPLALAMIGTEARHRPLAELAESLRTSSTVLKFGPGSEGIPERHRTLEATLRWSFDLLPNEAQSAMIALSAIEQDFDPKVCEVFNLQTETLHHLIQSNWISEPEIERVYRLLPPIQAFLRAKAPELVLQARSLLKTWLVDQIASNYPNNYSLVSEVAERYQADISAFESASESEPAFTQGSLLVGIQITAHRYGRVEHFLSRMSELLAKHNQPNWRNLLGSTEYLNRNYVEALPHFEQLLLTEDQDLRSVAKTNIALIKMSTGEPHEAVQLLRAAIGETGNPRRKGGRIINLVSCLCLTGQFSEAIHEANQALALFEQVGTLPSYIALCYQRRAEAEFLQKMTREAKASALIALDGFEETRQWHHMLELYMLLTLTAATEQDTTSLAKWAKLFIDQKPDSSALCGTFYHALSILGRQPDAETFSTGVDIHNVPLLLKSLPNPRQDLVPQPRSHWYALAKQTLKHL